MTLASQQGGPAMEFTRHARNEMRLYRVTAGEARRIANRPVDEKRDRDGNVRRRGFSDDGREIIVVVAGDDRTW